jgi:hypothetical protein
MQRERAVAVEKAQQNALSNKSKRVTGFSMGKQSGRYDARHRKNRVVGWKQTRYSIPEI